MLHLTLDELGFCDGVKTSKLFVAVKGVIYDVGATEAGRNFYAKGGEGLLGVIRVYMTVY